MNQDTLNKRQLAIVALGEIAGCQASKPADVVRALDALDSYIRARVSDGLLEAAERNPRRLQFALALAATKVNDP